MRKESRGESLDVEIGDPVSVRHVQPQEIRMQLLALCDEMTHGHRAKISAEQAHSVKESREGENPLRFGKAARKNPLKNDRGNEADEGEGLANAHQQFGAVVI